MLKNFFIPNPPKIRVKIFDRFYVTSIFLQNHPYMDVRSQENHKSNLFWPLPPLLAKNVGQN